MKNIFGKKCLLDTNIFIFAYDSKSTHYEKAHVLLTAVEEGKFQCFVALNTLLEFGAVLTKAYKISPIEVAHDITLLQNSQKNTILYPTLTVFQEFLALLQRDTGVYIYDLFIAATARSYGMDYIITDDRDFARIKGVKVFNPFEK